MGVTTKIRRQGGAAVMTIPPALLKLMGAEVGSQLELAVEEGVLVASTVKSGRRRYTLQELLEGHEALPSLKPDDGFLSDGEPVGKEIL